MTELGCDMWIHNECSFIAETRYETVNNTNCTWICPICEFFNFSDEQVNLETENRFVPLTKEKKDRYSPCGTNKSMLKFISMNINSIRGKNWKLLYRKDRNIHGGGVTLLVHKDISHIPITDVLLYMRYIIC